MPDGLLEAEARIQDRCEELVVDVLDVNRWWRGECSVTLDVEL